MLCIYKYNYVNIMTTDTLNIVPILNDDKQCPYILHCMEYVVLSFNCVLPKGGLEGVVWVGL